LLIAHKVYFENVPIFECTKLFLFTVIFLPLSNFFQSISFCYDMLGLIAWLLPKYF